MGAKTHARGRVGLAVVARGALSVQAGNHAQRSVELEPVRLLKQELIQRQIAEVVGGILRRRPNRSVRR